MLCPRNASLLGLLFFHLTAGLVRAEVETGEVWTRVDSRDADSIKDIAVAGNLLIAVGSGGMISTSENGGVWKQAETHPAIFNALASGGGIHVAAGSGDSCYTSTDGSDWVRRVTGVAATWNDVVWTGSRFVMVGTSGAIVSSANGVDWTRETSGTTQSLLDVAVDAGVVQVLAANSSILRSATVGSWQIIPNSSFFFYHIAAKDGRVVAGGLNGVLNLRYSDNGSTWTKATVVKADDSNTSVRAIVTGPPGFVVLNESGQLLHSEDGVLWHQHVPPIMEEPVALRWTGSEFVAITQSRKTIRSADGRRWSADSMDRAQAHVWSGSLHVAVGSDGFIATSPDGLVWTSSASGTFNDLRGVAWNGSRFVATGELGTLLTSVDGVAWSPVPAGVWDFHDITWAGDRFIAVAGKAMIFSSADGLSWQISDPGQMDAVIWDGSRFVAVHTRNVLVSPDGESWQYLGDLPSSWISSDRIRAMVWTGSFYVAVGDYGLCFTSPDGMTWTKRSLTPPPSVSWKAVAWSGQEVIVTGGSQCLRSTDGITWSAVEGVPSFSSLAWTGDRWIGCVGGRTGYSLDGQTWISKLHNLSGASLVSIASGGGRYVAAGSNSSSPLILSSADGVAWTTHSFSGNRRITRVAWTAGHFVATLSDGRYLVSPDGSSWSEVAGATSEAKEFLVSTPDGFFAFEASSQLERSDDGALWAAGVSRGGVTYLNKVRHFAGKTFAFQDRDLLVNEGGHAWRRSWKGTSYEIADVIFYDGKYLLITRNAILESANALDWAPWPDAPGNSGGFSLGGLTPEGRLLVASVGETSPKKIRRHDETTGWTLPIDPPGDYLSRFETVEGRLLVYGGDCFSWSDDEGSTWSPPGPPPRLDSNLRDVAAFGDGFVAVGEYGRLLVSEDDGQSWEGVPTFSESYAYSVASNGSRLVALRGGLQTSTDGRTWEPVAGEPLYGSSVEWTGNKFVVLNYSGFSYASTDGLSWTPNPPTDGIDSISGVNGRVMGLSGRDVSSGLDVTALQTRQTFDFGPMASNGSVHVALRFGPWRSEDLISWDYRGSTATSPAGITWTGSRFVTVGGSASNSGYSADGLNWTSVSAARGIAVIWAGDRLYSFDGSGVVRTSPDGIVWTVVPDDTSQGLTAAAWAGSFGVAVGNSGTVIRSTDGSSWSTVAAGVTTRLSSVVWTGTKVVAVGNGGVMASSPDGLAWQSGNVGTVSTLNSVAHHGGLLVTVSDAGEIFSSVDGATWTKRFSHTGHSFSCVTWTGTRFAAVGRFGAVVLSEDGITWQVAVRGPGNLALARVTSAYSESFITAGTSGNRWLALGSMGSILHSDDGMVWHEAGRPVTTPLRDAVWVDNRFVVVGEAGVIVTSPDGAVWTKRETGTALDLVAVAKRGDAVVAVGEYGLIFRSKAGESPSSSFDSWAEPLEDDALETDPDGDGITNLAAYAMGWPTGRASGQLLTALPKIAPESPRQLLFSLGEEERFDVRYEIQRSTTLGTWTTVASRVRGAWSGTSAALISEWADGFGRRTVALDLPESTLAFYRLRFTKVSP